MLALLLTVAVFGALRAASDDGLCPVFVVLFAGWLLLCFAATGLAPQLLVFLFLPCVVDASERDTEEVLCRGRGRSFAGAWLVNFWAAAADCRR